MKRLAVLIPFLFLLGCASLGTDTGPAGTSSAPVNVSPVTTQPAVSASPAGLCAPDAWKHVYHPARLHVLTPGCVTVTGTVAAVKTEPDGDYHIRLALDPQFSSYLNPVNVSRQHGDLVLEPVCANPVTQADAVDACAGYHSELPVVKAGERISVTGSWVLDSEAGHGWNELHPIASITILS